MTIPNDAGNLLTYGDGTTSATYTYDNLNRKTQETVNYGPFSLTTGASYNANGTKKTFTYPNGTVIDYAYDQNNQIAGINIPDAGYITIGNYQWTRPASITLPGGGKREFNYDALMTTQAITGKDPNQNTLLNYSYGFDKMDNIKQRNTQAGNFAYNYDDLYRLNEVQKNTNPTEGYTYDPVGNRLTSQATTGNWTYDANNELISAPPSSAGQTGGTTYAYDQNGNTVQRNVNGVIQNFVYDVDNRLIEVRDASNNLVATYTYDPFGRRIRKQTGVGGQPIPSPLAGEGQGEGVITTYYLYSDEGLIGEYDASGNEIKAYGYKPNSTWSTDPIFMKQGTSYYFYHNDHLGTPQKMTDISGAVVWSATYDAFGKATVDAGSTITNNLRFPGQYFDAETGWHQNWERYYSPDTGRYITEDPLGLEAGDENFYNYVFANPVNDIDPTGEMPPAIAAYGYCLLQCMAINEFANRTGLLCELKEDNCATSCANPLNWLGFGKLKKLGMAAKTRISTKLHGNIADGRPATLYKKVDSEGNLLKWGVTKHENPAKRYTKNQIGDGDVIPIERGPRKEMLLKERNLVETNPGPDNHEPWAGKWR